MSLRTCSYLGGDSSAVVCVDSSRVCAPPYRRLASCISCTITPIQANFFLRSVVHTRISETDRRMATRRELAQRLRTARPFFLIAGPCVLESSKTVMHIATS